MNEEQKPILNKLGWVGLGLTVACGGFVASNVRGFLAESEWEGSRIQVAKVEEWLGAYAHQNGGAYPATLAELGPLLSGGEVPTDAWGHPLLYVHAADAPYLLVSLGKDGRIGGTGPDADIVAPVSW